MTIEKFRQVLHAQPFESFTIHVADGRQIDVRHPDFVSLSPAGRTVHVFHEDDHSEFIDLLMVTSIELHNGQPRRGTGRGRKKRD